MNESTRQRNLLYAWTRFRCTKKPNSYSFPQLKGLSIYVRMAEKVHTELMTLREQVQGHECFTGGISGAERLGR